MNCTKMQKLNGLKRFTRQSIIVLHCAKQLCADDVQNAPDKDNPLEKLIVVARL